MDTNRGLLLINTGDGKGKTTAAIGTAVRAAGNGFKVLFLQFIKSGGGYGELKSLETLGVDVRSMGKGFIYHKQEEDAEKMKVHQEAAQEAWEMVEQEVASDAWDMVVLDEVNYAIQFGLLDVETVVALVKNRPARLHMILTGRDARPELIELADTVTEMKVVKHAYQQGIKAKRGIEF